MDEDDLKLPDPTKAEATGSSASSVSDRGNHGNTFIPLSVNLHHMVILLNTFVPICVRNICSFRHVRFYKS